MPSPQCCSASASPCMFSARTVANPDCAGKPGTSSLVGNSGRPLLFCHSKVAGRSMTRIECTFERSPPNGSLTSSRPRFDCLRIGKRWESRSSLRPRETSSAPTMGAWTFSRFRSRRKNFAPASLPGDRPGLTVCERPVSGGQFVAHDVRNGSGPASRPSAPTGRYAAHSGRRWFGGPLVGLAAGPATQFGQERTVARDCFGVGWWRPRNVCSK